MDGIITSKQAQDLAPGDVIATRSDHPWLVGAGIVVGLGLWWSLVVNAWLHNHALAVVLVVVPIIILLALFGEDSSGELTEQERQAL